MVTQRSGVDLTTCDGEKLGHDSSADYVVQIGIFLFLMNFTFTLYPNIATKMKLILCHRHQRVSHDSFPVHM